MCSFEIGNSCSVNLNFLLYINNLYSNINNHSDIPTVYPWLPIDHKSLLKQNEFEVLSQDLWFKIFHDIELEKTDLKWWIENKYSFETLFTNDELGNKNYENVKKSFNSWFWTLGQSFCLSLTDSLTETYYNKLTIFASKENMPLPDARLILQTVYHQPPFYWLNRKRNMIIISPYSQFNLPTVEEIYNSCLK